MKTERAASKLEGRINEWQTCVKPRVAPFPTTRTRQELLQAPKADPVERDEFREAIREERELSRQLIDVVAREQALHAAILHRQSRREASPAAATRLSRPTARDIENAFAEASREYRDAAMARAFCIGAVALTLLGVLVWGLLSLTS